jgi:hypothetical protein
MSDAEDAKLVVLARAARSRGGSGEGAALRDAEGRIYSAAGVDLPSLRLSALQLAVAMAVSSGAAAVAAAVVVTDSLAASTADTDVVRDATGPGVPIYRVDSSGAVSDVRTS